MNAGEREGLQEALAAHDGMSFDLGTPREFTQHGGWNAACSCGEHLCSHPGGECDCLLEHTAAAVLDWLRARLASDGVREAVAVEIHNAQWHDEGDCTDPRGCGQDMATTWAADAALTAVLAALDGTQDAQNRDLTASEDENGRRDHRDDEGRCGARDGSGHV